MGFDKLCRWLGEMLEEVVKVAFDGLVVAFLAVVTAATAYSIKVKWKTVDPEVLGVFVLFVSLASFFFVLATLLEPLIM